MKALRDFALGVDVNSGLKINSVTIGTKEVLMCNHIIVRMEHGLDFTKCRQMKPPKRFQLASQPKRPILHPHKYRHICATCHFRYAKKSDLKLHLRSRHNPTFKRSANFERECEMLEYCPLCHFRGSNRVQLCDHFKNSHPLELIGLMFSDREQFVYLSSSCKQINKQQ